MDDTTGRVPLGHKAPSALIEALHCTTSAMLAWKYKPILVARCKQQLYLSKTLFLDLVTAGWYIMTYQR